MGVLESIIDGLSSLLSLVGSWISALNPCPFRDGIDFGSSFNTAFAVLNVFVDVPACVAAVMAWAVALGVCWLVMLLWHWLKAA